MMLSIIIPTMNRGEQLDELLRSMRADIEWLERTAHTFEILICNDGVEDAGGASRYLPLPVRWLEGPKRGPAANRNVGIRQSTGDLVVLLDDDVVVQSGCLRAYVAAAEADSSGTFGVLEGATLPERARGRLDEISPLNEAGGYWWTCNLAVRRWVFVDAGLFDERFVYADMEDVELRVRLGKRGVRSLFVSDAAVVHPWRIANPRRKEVTHRGSVPVLLTLHPELAKNFGRRYYLMTIRHELRVLLTLAVPLRGRGMRGALASIAMACRLVARPPQRHISAPSK